MFCSGFLDKKEGLKSQWKSSLRGIALICIEFYIDGEIQDLDTTRSDTRLSGDLDWQIVSIPISAGEHTLVFEYTKDGSVSSNSDSVWVDDVTLPLSTEPSATEFYSDWADDYGLGNDLNVDSDQDGMSDLLEYAVGTDPTENGTSVLSVSSMIDDDLEYFTLTIPQRKDAAARGLEYIVRRSTDLQEWSEVGVEPVVTEPINSEFDQVTYRVSSPIHLEEKVFLKFDVSITE